MCVWSELTAVQDYEMHYTNAWLKRFVFNLYLNSVWTPIIIRKAIPEFGSQIWKSYTSFSGHCYPRYYQESRVPFRYFTRTASIYSDVSMGKSLFSPVTYTIIQSIMRSEMCSLHLTHPSVHLEQWAADCAVPGEQSWTFCRSRDSNPQPWVTSGFKSNALAIRPTTALYQHNNGN